MNNPALTPGPGQRPPLPFTIVHAVPGRLRLRLPVLGQPHLDQAYLETWLEGTPGVQEVRINRAARSLVVIHDRDAGVRARVLARLGAFDPDAGLPLLPEEGSGDEDEDIVPIARSLATLALLPLLSPGAQKLVTFVNLGSTLGKGAETLISEGIKVEVLDAVAVGLSAARGEHYTANITGLLLALGEYLERRTARQSDRMLRRLLRPEPTLAWVERAGELVQVPGQEVREGEVVVVGVGEQIPVDGRVLEGAALVNQAAVTGEQVPVRKEAPRRVVAGSLVVEGRLRIEATQVGEETTTARVSRFVRESLGKRSQTQRLADDLADKRVYITLATGGLAYALTRDLRRLESVLLVDYSCALKLGTPIAFKSGMVASANHGVLMKGGEAIEQLAAVDTIIFDKTGTLTHSELTVTEVVVLRPDAGDETKLLALVASVEEHASHPVAQAVVEAARERDLKHISHGEVDYLVAHGMTAEVGGERVVIGSRHYLEEHQGIHFSAHEARILALQEQGRILLFVADDRGPLGLIALRDTLRADARPTLERLRGLGIRHLVMISGDRRAKAEALAAELGLDEVHAEMEPEDKARIVQELRDQGRRVAFVGDGVNDGPALVAADVGIAMPRGADLARATADIVLLDDHLASLADARETATRTMGLIRTNFNLAVGINTAILAGAMTGWLSPVASALLHNGTTMGILVHALAGARGHAGRSPPGPWAPS
ncbi:MAG: heavy metal translocating P-type ATPase [Gammaproteobacteria bacterium]|jgi:heavy metal translocating P-type ATPase|nr:heavy metal translocating P-type ATPase [Gammaproteobacteria bacterium]